jgi:hypothetical protein
LFECETHGFINRIGLDLDTGSLLHLPGFPLRARDPVSAQGTRILEKNRETVALSGLFVIAIV